MGWGKLNPLSNTGINKGISNLGQGLANVATLGIGKNMFSKKAQKISAPIVEIEQVGLALPFAMMTAGQSNKLLPKGTQESPAGQASTVTAEVATVGGALVAGGYALAGGFAGLSGSDLIPKGSPSPTPIISVESPQSKNDYTVPMITGAILLLASKML